MPEATQQKGRTMNTMIVTKHSANPRETSQPVSPPQRTPSRQIPDNPRGVISGESKELAVNIRRIQAEEALRVERAEQDRLARLREKARLD